MAKFKVGDRVRRVDGTDYGQPLGQEVVVVPPLDGMDYIQGVIWYQPTPSDPAVWSDELNWELVNTGPIRTITKVMPEIVSGRYGIVSVSGGAFFDGSVRPWVELTLTGDDDRYDAPELTDAIATLTAIRDALVEVA